MSYALPDTIKLEDVPPVSFEGELTRPSRVTIYQDTASSPTSRVEGVAVDTEHETVTVRSRSGDSTIAQTFRLPEYGETLQLRSDSVAFNGRVAGAPTAEDVEVTTSSIDKPWHTHIGDWLWTIGAVLMGGVVVVLIILRGLP